MLVNRIQINPHFVLVPGRTIQAMIPSSIAQSMKNTLMKPSSRQKPRRPPPTTRKKSRLHPRPPKRTNSPKVWVKASRQGHSVPQGHPSHQPITGRAPRANLKTHSH